MPFTLSHAAAVLPAVRADGSGRGRLVPAALVAGSFAPDMTYYAASVRPEAMEFGDVTHSFAGVFTVDVVTAWALVGLWLLVREPLVALLPRGRQGPLAALTRCGAPRARVRPPLLLRWYLSAALGSLTHVVWDAFTHLDRWGMRLFPVLGEQIAGSPLYWYLQYGGSAVAAVVIAVFVAHALRRTPGGEPEGVAVLSAGDRWRAGALIGGCALVAAARRATRWWEYWGARDAKPWELVPTLCFGAGAGLVLGVLLYAVGVRLWRPAARSGYEERPDAGTAAGTAMRTTTGAQADAGAGAVSVRRGRPDVR
ncbi:hypothetical protein GCM10010269_08110 [Streptomyces humidus]|uniref:DUF4184 family protein n=1 Tax=Streptomyces humidus TaxID=52259 RepID=A0A918L1F8_9ACTN|nr:DUF4184 family protein [Streptomyces humidus]GGR71574.1 hypothetical protein GCM10010269_08110 [Streptomyces humidus]